MSRFKAITLGQYVPGATVLHRLDPRAKIIALFLLVVAIFIVRSFLGYLALGLFVGVLFYTSNLPPGYFIRGLRPILYILIFTIIVHTFFTNGGQVYLDLGFLTVEQEGVRLAAFMSLRIIFLVSTTSLLTLTTSPLALTDALEYLLHPLQRLGLPVHELAMMMTIALRFIPTLMEESEKIMKAQMARGADFESGNIWRRAQSLVPLLVPLFVSSFRRADDLAIAMEARCYRGGKGRTRMRELAAAPRDYVSVAAMTMLVVLLLWAQV